MSREMKDSGILAIGAIPKEWKQIRIKYLLQNGVIKSGPYGSVLKEVTSTDGEYPIYNQANIINDDFSLRRNYISSKDYINMKRYKIQSGDIVFSMMGTVGKCSIVPEWIDEGIIDSHLFEAKLNYLINKDYFKYSYDKDLCVQVIEQFVEAMNGSIMSGLNGGLVKNSFICLPSPTEQQQIVHFLDRKCTAIDTAIEKTKKSIEKLEEYKKAVITKAVTKGIDPNAKMKDSGVEWIGEIPEGWDVIKLKYLLKDSMKYGATETGIEYSEELPRYIRITDITSDNKLKDSGKLSLTEQQAEKYLLKEDTILFARSGATVGKTFLYKTEYGRAAFAGYLISAIPNNDKLLATWLYYYTLSFSYADWVKRSFLQATIQNIGADKYSNLLISLPCMNKQSEIVKYLDDKCAMFDVVIKKKKKAIEKWEEYKKSLIYYAVTGKIDCRNEVIE